MRGKKRGAERGTTRRKEPNVAHAFISAHTCTLMASIRPCTSASSAPLARRHGSMSLFSTATMYEWLWCGSRGRLSGEERASAESKALCVLRAYSRGALASCHSTKSDSATLSSNVGPGSPAEGVTGKGTGGKGA